MAGKPKRGSAGKRTKRTARGKVKDLAPGAKAGKVKGGILIGLAVPPVQNAPLMLPYIEQDNLYRGSR